MSFWNKLKPKFWNKSTLMPGASRHQFNYSRIWRMNVLLAGGVALLPLIFITIVNYMAMQHSIESEFKLLTTRIVSNTQRAIAFFLAERKSALQFIVLDNSLESLNHQERLEDMLVNLQASFGGGFVDLGIIDESGRQRNYAGPYKLEGKNYTGQKWFGQVVDSGVYISDVFLGYRQVPHMVVAVKGFNSDGSFYVLRASIELAIFENLLSNLELAGQGDAFLINREGVLQTSSRYCGSVLDKLDLPIPKYAEKTDVFEAKCRDGQDFLVGYRYIDDSPFVLLVIKQKEELMKPWFRTRLKLVVFLLVSVTIILSVLLGTVTYMVNQIQLADEKRVVALHQIEYENKMASIGRMAAGVAHEINNPLAIINEKTGLIKDLFLIRQEYKNDEKLIGLADAIIASVKRAGTITKGLLTFSQNLQGHIEEIHLERIVRDVLSFLGKEAALKGIDIRVEIPPEIPSFACDRGKLQQIFLNIINNAFAALKEGGSLNIEARTAGEKFVSVMFADNGCGIPKEDVNRIFEPFFSTKTGQGGTGLGLSITYRLVQEIGGRIDVRSEVDKGTTFTVFIPQEARKKEA